MLLCPVACSDVSPYMYVVVPDLSDVSWCVSPYLRCVLHDVLYLLIFAVCVTIFYLLISAVCFTMFYLLISAVCYGAWSVLCCQSFAVSAVSCVISAVLSAVSSDLCCVLCCH